MMNRGHLVLAVLLGSAAIVGRSTSAASAAAADGTPLVVVVETDGRDRTGADTIRRAIATELGRPVVGPQDRLADTATDLLLVRVEGEVVTMRVRSARGEGPHRRVDGLPTGPAGVKMIAWLAGNLVRDQTGDLLAGAAESSGTAAPAVEAQPRREVNATPAPQPAPSTAPPTPSLPAPLMVAATARPAEPSATPPPPDALDWRLGVTLGTGQRLFPDSTQAVRKDRDVTTVRLELLTARFGRHWNGWGGATYHGGYLTGFGLSAGVICRWEPWPSWLAIELGGGAGFLVGRRSITLLSPGGPQPANSGIEGQLIGHALGNLVFTHWRQVAEVFVGGGADGSWSWKANPDAAFTAGVRLRLP